MYDSTYESPEQVRARKQRNTTISIVALLLAVGGSILYSYYDWTNFSFKPDLIENWSSIFMKYFFIIVAMERAAAVWTGIERNEAKRTWDRRVKRVREVLEIKFADVSIAELKQTYHREKIIIDEITHNSKSFIGVDDPYLDDDKKKITYKNKPEDEKHALIGYLRAVKHSYEFRRTKFEERTYKMITRIVFVGGVVFAAIGLSILGDILDIEPVENQTQIFFYRLGDIVITGGLLGGGSKSFSVFINTLDRIFNRAKDPGGES